MVLPLLGWDKRRMQERCEELLELVGLPGDLAGRFPSQLSGGQRQRVGVARALAADPPLMLMDEPFGAIDPINRDRLQSEFLRLQSEIRKTIVFVTHDIDEAIKMGDRIAILREGGELVQYDTPDRILALSLMMTDSLRPLVVLDGMGRVAGYVSIEMINRSLGPASRSDAPAREGMAQA